MSARAIRALRGSAADPLLPQHHDDDDPDDTDEQPKATRPAFGAFHNDDDSSSSSSDEEIQQDNEEDKEKRELMSATPPPSTKMTAQDDKNQEEEEDWDAILSEFQIHDTKTTIPAASQQKGTTRNMSPFSILVRNMDPRDLDMEQSLRMVMLEQLQDEASNAAPQLQSSNRHKTNKRLYFFGPSRENWPKPPNLVGGGMGFKTYAELDPTVMVPWPYYSPDRDENNKSRWFQIVYSDNYQHDANDFDLVQNSGDVNALVQFVCHHPYHCPALLQLARVLYQTDRSQQGLALLRRCLWVYESSFGHSLARDHLQGNLVYMDATQETNLAFFQAMMKLLQVANIAG